MAAPMATPAGPPIPFWPSVVIKPETVRGVQTYYANLILDILFGIFALVIGGSSLLVSTSDAASALASAAILAAASCGLVVVFVINFILSLMSVIRMHHGADEYGPEHATNARRGVMFKWIGTTLSTLAVILVVYLAVGGSSVFFGGRVSATLFVPLLVTIFWTAGVGAKGQMYRFMVRSLQPPQTRQLSDVASFLIPGLGMLGILTVGYATVRVLDLATNPSIVTPEEASRLFSLLVGGIFLPPGLALVGYVVFLWIYGRTRSRLNEGLMHLYAAVPRPPAWSYPAPPTGAAMAAAAAAPAVAPAPCPRCGFASAASATFCANCGAPLRP